LEARDEELALMDTVSDAEEIFQKTGTWPTFGEVMTTAGKKLTPTGRSTLGETHRDEKPQ